jgi:UDP-N-acetylglucosamine 3-dehydrogenase
MAVVKYGVIGCGAIGQRRHIPEIVAGADSKLVAVADINEKRAQEVAAKHGVQAYTDYKQLLKQADIDAVVVCGPNYVHAEQTIAAFKAGKHVLVEKPMATTRKDAKAMIEAATKAGKNLMVGQNQRLASAHIKAKQIIDSGAIGKVLAFRTSFKHPGPDGWSLDGAGSWFFVKEKAVMGVLGDLGVHKIDLMRWLLGQEFVQVSALLATQDKTYPNGKPIDLDDNAIIHLKTDKGVIGSVEIAWTNYGGEDNITVVYGQKGVLSIGIDPTYAVIVEYRNGGKELHKVGAMATNTKQVGSGIADAFTESILRKRKPEIDGREGYQSVNVILTAIDAFNAGKTLKIV